MTYLRLYYDAGGPPRAISIGTTSTLVLKSRSTRKKVILVNDSDEDIYVARADSAVLNAGIRLNADGGALVDEPDTLGRIYTGPWYAICASGSKNLCVSEDL